MKINYNDLLDIMGKLPADIEKYPKDFIKFAIIGDPVMTLSSYPNKEDIPFLEVIAVKNYTKKIGI